MTDSTEEPTTDTEPPADADAKLAPVEEVLMDLSPGNPRLAFFAPLPELPQ